MILEKEVRGSITKENLLAIENYAKENNIKYNKYKQISIYLDTDNIKEIGSVSSGKARIIIDIRGNNLLLKIKLGNALAFDRKEYVIKSFKESFESIAILFKLFGITNGYVRTFDRTDYQIGNISLTIKLNCNMGNHFELERNTDDINDINNFEMLIHKLNLKIWSKEMLAKKIEDDHQSVKSINILETLRSILKDDIDER